MLTLQYRAYGSRLFVIAAALIALASCGGSGGGSASNEVVAQGLIGPEGGELVLGDSVVIFTVPAGALTEEILFSMTFDDDSEGSLLNPVDIEPSGTEFLVDATVSFWHPGPAR